MDFKVGNIRVIDVLWFDSVGFVKGEDEITGETKFYVGSSFRRAPLHYGGGDELKDIEFIVEWGTKYTPQGFEQLTNWLGAPKIADLQQQIADLKTELEEYKKHDWHCCNSTDEVIETCDKCDLPECIGCDHSGAVARGIKQLKAEIEHYRDTIKELIAEIEAVGKQRGIF